MKIHGIVYREGLKIFWKPVCALCQTPFERLIPTPDGLTFGGHGFVCNKCEERHVNDNLALATADAVAVASEMLP